MRSPQEQLAQLQQQNAALSASLDLLKEENRWLKAQLFGRSSEKRRVDECSPDQGKLLFNEAEAIAHTPSASAAPEALHVPAHVSLRRLIESSPRGF